jgi:hypothetical protein
MHKRTINGPKCRVIAGTSTTLKLPLNVSFMKVTGTASTDTKKKRPSSQGKPDSSNQHFDIASIFLAGKEKPKSSLSIASSTWSIVLRHVLDVQRAKDLARVKAGFHRRFWILRNIDEVTDYLKANRDLYQGVKIRTADFTAMYTKLSQQVIIDNVSKAVKEAFNYYLTTIQTDQTPEGSDPLALKNVTIKVNRYTHMTEWGQIPTAKAKWEAVEPICADGCLSPRF